MVALYLPAGIKPRRGVPPRSLFPANYERSYARFIREYTSNLKDVTDKVIVPRLPFFHASFNDSVSVNDGFSDQIKERIAIAKILFNERIPDAEIILKSLSKSINIYNLTQHVKQIKWAFGIDLFGLEPWVQASTESWVSENVSLIKSIPDTYFREIEELMVREIRAGTRVESIARMIADRTGVSESRGLLIARDQVGKFNGQLSKRRQEDAGIKRYIWRTVGDERVRPSHRANNGKTFSWDKPPEKTGHVGQDIQCRCYAEPIFTDV